MMKILLSCLLFISASVFAFATASTPAVVNSIVCTSGTCTITAATAHNIPNSNEDGYCLQGGPAADVQCGTAATVPSTTTLTITSATMTTCSSACGTVQPAKNFLILGNPFNGQLGLQSVTACVWIYVQSPLPVANKSTACAAAETNGTLLTAENGALATGQWFETVYTLNFASTDTRAQIEQEFQRIQLAAQNQFTAGIQFGRDLGTFCDVIGCNQ